MAAQATQVDPVVEFNKLLGRAGVMVSTLAQKSVTSGTFVQAVKDFQLAWNESRDIVHGELDAMIRAFTKDPKAGLDTRNNPIPDEVLNVGLSPDGKYGARTAIALAYTCWTKLGKVEEPNGMPAQLAIIPVDPRSWPTVYPTNRSMFDNMFLPVIVDEPPSTPATPPPEKPATTPKPKKPKPAPTSEPPVPSTETVVDFGADEAPVVRGQTQGSTSIAPVLAAAAGVVVLGGIIYAATRKRRGRR